MYERIKKEGGFTLIEIVVILAVIAIIAAAMVPRISGIMDDAKISRAQSEVQTVGMALLRFNANTGRWPARDSSGSDNQLVTLRSGTATNSVRLPGYSGTAPARFTDETADDYFDNHLRLNQPEGTASAGYATTGIDRWNGPYLQQVGADPWGNAYVCNIVAAYENSTTADLYCYVISGGPDGTIQTDASVASGEVSSHAVSGDDIAFLVRARQ